MPDSNTFGGTNTYIPSVQVQVNTSGLGPLSVNSNLIPAIIGQGLGSQPGVATTYYTPSQALATIRGGDLLDAVLRCFTPSTIYPGPTQVVAMRVNPAVAATANLLDTNSAATITVTSANYGVLDNNISITIGAGTSSGSMVTVTFVGTNQAPGIPAATYIGNNIGRNEFTLQYIGTATSCTATITETSLTTNSSNGGGENLNIAFSQFSTVTALVSYLNSAYSTLYSAAVVSPNPNDPTAASLDHITAQAIKSSAYTVTANVQAIVNWLNGGYQPLVTAARAASTTGLIPKNQVVFLTGGVEISTTAHLDGSTSSPGTLDPVHDWGYAINLMANATVDIEVVLSGLTQVWGEVNTSMASLASNGVTARRAICGTALGQSESTIPTVVGEVPTYLNTDRVMLVMQGINDISFTSGLATNYAGYITAAQIAGLMAGQPIGTAITFKQLKGTGVEWNPVTSDLQTMLAGGIMPIQFVPVYNYVRCVRGISSWLQDNNFFRVEFATGQAVDKVVKDMFAALTQFLGGPVSPNQIYQIASTVETVLTNEQNNGLIIGSISSTGSVGPGFSNIVASGSGDTVAVSFSASFVIPNNFINVTINATQFSGTTTVAVGTI